MEEGGHSSLEEMLGVHRSLGSICGVLTQAASRAQALPPPVPAHPVHAAADEVYAAHQPGLEVVKHTSGLILALEPVEHADETTWGCMLLELEQRGVQVERLVAEGGKGHRARPGPLARVAGAGTGRELPAE